MRVNWGNQLLNISDYCKKNIPNVKITSRNSPPNKPTITGADSGEPQTEYTYYVSTNDPDGDQVSYCFDWGDKTNNVWRGPYASGVTASASHSWYLLGSYQIKVKAKDIYGAESEWKIFSVDMPKNRVLLKSFLSKIVSLESFLGY